MNPMRSVRTGLTLAAIAALAVVVGVGCGELTNDSPPKNVTVVLGFGDGAGNPLLDGVIAQPSGTGETILSIAVGAIVISRATPYSGADDVDEADSEQLTDDAIQSAAFVTIEDLPFAGDSISFLIPPDTAGNWQLVGVGSRIDIDVLDDFEGEDPSGRGAPIWYGFTPTFQNEQIEPGDTVTLTLEPGCALDEPPDGAGC